MNLKLVMASTCLVIFSFSELALACLETPKNLQIDSASFSKDIKIAYQTNCKPSVTIENGKKTYLLRESMTEKKPCLTISDNNDSTSENKASTVICLGTSLKDQEKQLLSLNSEKKKNVGRIHLMDDGVEIQSASKGTKMSLMTKVVISFKNPTSWLLEIKDSKNSTTGAALIESHGCTKGMPKEGVGSVVLNGKYLTTSGAGCASGVNVQKFKQSLLESL